MYNEHNPYEIVLSELQTIENLAHVLDHLSGKVWFNPQEVWKHSVHQMCRDQNSALHFFQVLVALNRRGKL